MAALLSRREGGVHVPDIQRSRLLAAAVGTIEQFGYADATVARITARARVSRRTFYELFEDREECLVAVFDSVIEQITFELEAAGLDGLPWRERVRGGLWVILSFMDREPALARVCVLESQRADRQVLERRQGILDQLAEVVDQGRYEVLEKSRPVALTGQGVVGGVLAILYARLLAGDGSSLGDLLGELMAMIVRPYMGAQAARREQDRPNPSTPDLSLDGEGEVPSSALVSAARLAALPMRLTHRTARVLKDLAEHPASSNRQVAERTGVHDQGQISKLLSRLQRLGLVTNGVKGAPARGEANEWRLTANGASFARSIHLNSHPTDDGRLDRGDLQTNGTRESH